MKKTIVLAVLLSMVVLGTSFAGNFGFGITGSGNGTKIEGANPTTDDFYNIGVLLIAKLDFIRIEPAFSVSNWTELDPTNVDANIAADRKMTRFIGSVAGLFTPVTAGPVSVLIGGNAGLYFEGKPSDATTYDSTTLGLFLDIPVAAELALTENVALRISQSVAYFATRTNTFKPSVGTETKTTNTSFSFSNQWAPSFSLNFTF